MMFWGELTPEQGKRYQELSALIKAYVMWMSTKPEERVGVCPPCPSDEEFISHELMAMKGWRMI